MTGKVLISGGNSPGRLLLHDRERRFNEEAAADRRGELFGRSDATKESISASMRPPLQSAAAEICLQACARYRPCSPVFRPTSMRPPLISGGLISPTMMRTIGSAIRRISFNEAAADQRRR